MLLTIHKISAEVFTLATSAISSQALVKTKEVVATWWMLKGLQGMFTYATKVPLFRLWVGELNGKVVKLVESTLHAEISRSLKLRPIALTPSPQKAPLGVGVHRKISKEMSFSRPLPCPSPLSSGSLQFLAPERRSGSVAEAWHACHPQDFAEEASPRVYSRVY